jgi:hypothetical protein
MRKKIVGIFVCMLLISSTTTMVLFSDTVKVEASGGGPPSSQEIGLDYDFVWNMTDNFSKVIYRTDWSDENNIPKGRCCLGDRRRELHERYYFMAKIWVP